MIWNLKKYNSKREFFTLYNISPLKPFSKPESDECLPAEVVGADHVVVHEGEADDRVLPAALLAAHVAEQFKQSTDVY